jgi:hypothetical protein
VERAKKNMDVVGKPSHANGYDMNLFYAAIKITVGNGAKTPFWEAPWLNELKTKDIAILIFMSSRRKEWNVKTALFENVWVEIINSTADFTYDHMATWCNLKSYGPNFKTSI